MIPSITAVSTIAPQLNITTGHHNGRPANTTAGSSHTSQVTPPLATNNAGDVSNTTPHAGSISSVLSTVIAPSINVEPTHAPIDPKFGSGVSTTNLESGRLESTGDTNDFSDFLNARTEEEKVLFVICGVFVTGLILCCLIFLGKKAKDMIAKKKCCNRRNRTNHHSALAERNPGGRLRNFRQLVRNPRAHLGNPHQHLGNRHQHLGNLHRHLENHRPNFGDPLPPHGVWGDNNVYIPQTGQGAGLPHTRYPIPHHVSIELVEHPGSNLGSAQKDVESANIEPTPSDIESADIKPNHSDVESNPTPNECSPQSEFNAEDLQSQKLPKYVPKHSEH